MLPHFPHLFLPPHLAMQEGRQLIMGRQKVGRTLLFYPPLHHPPGFIIIILQLYHHQLTPRAPLLIIHQYYQYGATGTSGKWYFLIIHQ